MSNLKLSSPNNGYGAKTKEALIIIGIYLIDFYFVFAGVKQHRILPSILPIGLGVLINVVK